MAKEGSGARLGSALLAYMLGLTLIATLFPFQFEWPERWRIAYTGEAIDAAANVLLFVPLGFLFRLARANAPRRPASSLLWIGALASLALESAQIFEAVRYPSVLDVATNAVGAWLGALVFDWLESRLRVDGKTIGRFFLALPLMGLVYLLVPLLWLDALAAVVLQELEPKAGMDWGRALLPLLLGIVGAMVLGGLQRHYFAPSGAATPEVMAAAAMAWFLAGSFPTLSVFPWASVAATLLVGGLVWLRGSRPLAPSSRDRRFEVPVLKSVAPAFAAYLALLALLPLREGVGPWELGLGFPGAATQWKEIEDLRFLEQVAAFTLLGYMVAEWRGRVLSSFRAALPRAMGWGATAAVLAEVVRGWHAGQGASIASGLILATATLYGAWLYYLQLAHVLSLVGSGEDAAPPGAARLSG